MNKLLDTINEYFKEQKSNKDCPICEGHMIHSLIESFCSNCHYVSDMQEDE